MPRGERVVNSLASETVYVRNQLAFQLYTEPGKMLHVYYINVYIVILSRKSRAWSKGAAQAAYSFEGAHKEVVGQEHGAMGRSAGA